MVFPENSTSRNPFTQRAATSWRKLSRTKDPRSVNNDMAVSLTSEIDLTSAGLHGGAVLSVGAFVAAGQVVKDVAGDAAVLSVIVATVVACVLGKS